MLLGERIKEEREKKGISQTELAELAGVHEVTISKWENGKKPSLSSLEKLARALGIPVAFLLNSRESGDDPALLAQEPLPRQSARLDTSPKISVPVISAQTPACAGNGNSIEAAIAEAEDFIDVDRYALPILDDLRRPFAIYVDGDSMEEMDIPDGSMAVINPAEDVRDGECALVCYKGLWSIKGVRWNRDGSISLLAGKPQYNMTIPQPETEDDLWFSILGKVVEVHKRHRPKRFF